MFNNLLIIRKEIMKNEVEAEVTEENGEGLQGVMIMNVGEREDRRQDNEQMRSAFGGCFFKRQCALLLFYHR